MLERDTKHAWVSGVAAGLAEEYGMPVSLVRLFFVLTFFLFGLGLLLYWWFWAAMPENNHTIRMNFT